MDYKTHTMKLQKECNDCNNKGYINTYNTLINKQEIQRCDNCKIYKNDIQAMEQYSKCSNT